MVIESSKGRKYSIDFKKAINPSHLISRCYKINICKFNSIMIIYKKIIVPQLLYRSELWGIDDHKELDKY